MSEEENAEIWKNWRTFTIKGHQGTRSACPHYKGKPPDGVGGKDSDQNMDAAAIKQLKGIKYIISANAKDLKSSEKQALTKAGIGFFHRPVKDFGAPTPDDFKAVYNEYRAHTDGCHFYCGWGNGRSGTYITGVEIQDGVYSHKPTRADYDKNHVEDSTQRTALDKLWEEWHKSH